VEQGISEERSFPDINLFWRGEAMFKKILVPLDGSELAAKVLTQVEDLAKVFNAEVTLFTCGSISSLTYTARGEIAEPKSRVIVEAERHTKEGAEKYLAETADALRAKGINVNYVYREGTPAREIIKHAEGDGYDLIALASHGRGEVAWVLGSVAEKIVSHAPVPVLLLRVMEMKPPLLKEEFFLGA
jgi:nucleotide-binding universal stress UspA family protein